MNTPPPGGDETTRRGARGVPLLLFLLLQLCVSVGEDCGGDAETQGRRD